MDRTLSSHAQVLNLIEVKGGQRGILKILAVNLCHYLHFLYKLDEDVQPHLGGKGLKGGIRKMFI